MRLFFFIQFIFSSFIALSSELISKNKNNILIAPLDTTKGVIIQNSPKKGNGALDASGRNGYNDSAGKNFGYVIIWTRVLNETTTPLELKVNFPADSFAISGQPQAYAKFFLPSDTMTFDKEPLLDYGLTNLKSFLDANFNKPTHLQRIIKPKEEYLFYVVTVSYAFNGTSRSGIILKDQNLFYQTNMLDSLILCGNIVIKK